MSEIVGHIRHIRNGSELSSLNDIVSSFFSNSDLDDGSLFSESFDTFLIFDYQTITEPHLFSIFATHDEALAFYVGHLNSGSAPVSVDGAIHVPKEVAGREISAAFNDQISPVDGPIQIFVQRGFVIPTSAEWAIWFSSYWEVAIAGFSSTESASKFRASHPEVRFESNEIATDRYRMNPTSPAPRFLRPYFTRNLVELR
jgi:hypothetical protein